MLNEQMDKKLKENEQWYATILKNINEGVIVTDKNRKITFMNLVAEALTGWKQEDAYGKDLVDILEIMNESTDSLTKNFAIVLWEEITKGLRSGLSRDLKLLSKDGTETIIECRASLIMNDNQDMIGVAFMFRDITEQKQQEEVKTNMYQQQLIQADKMKSLGTLVSGVAHEINNPNNFIMLNTPILQDVWNDVVPVLEQYYRDNGNFNMGGLKYTEMREYTTQFFSGITDGAKRIKRIVSDLKDFARQGTSDMNQLIDINSVVRSALALVYNQIKKASMNFQVEYGNDLPMLKGNCQRLEQVIINLILNACQSLKDKKKGIFVSTCCVDTSDIVTVKIRDEGDGIPADILPRIVDPFFTTRRNSGGTGLGLSVSSGIVREHGGKLEFSSVEGEGTTAIITLPVNIR